LAIDNLVKSFLHWVIIMMACVLVVAQARAIDTNADWTFPTGTTPGPNQPIAANLSTNSIDDYLGWIVANSGKNNLAASFVSNPGSTTALEFSYNGNHPEFLNGSALTLTTTFSGLPTGSSFTNIQLSYDNKWNKTGNTLTETWAYSINGGAFLNFLTNGIAGNAGWQTTTASLAGLQLQNGDTIAFRDTFSGAVGVNGNLDFDNIQITSGSIISVPEPSPLALLALGISFVGVWRASESGRKRRLVAALLALMAPRRLGFT
jgi:hypothetical protein